MARLCLFELQAYLCPLNWLGNHFLFPPASLQSLRNRRMDIQRPKVIEKAVHFFVLTKGVTGSLWSWASGQELNKGGFPGGAVVKNPCLPMQGTQVRALVREDPTCHGAAKPMRHNYWACALEPASHNYWSLHAYSPCSATREATAMRSPCTAMKSSPRSPQLEKTCAQQQRPNSAINK